MGSKRRPSKGSVSWSLQLNTLYEEILKQPLSNFPQDAVYALYHSADRETFGAATPSREQLLGLEPYFLSTETGREPEHPVMTCEWRMSHYPIDLASSLAVFESIDFVPEALHTNLKTDALDQCVVCGAELVGQEKAFEDVSHFAFRVKTDNSLTDAMTTLLHLRSGTESLLQGETTRGWVSDCISNPAFRDHLQAILVDRDSYLEVPGSDEIDAVVLCWGTPLLSLYVGEGGHHWNIVRLE